MTETKLQDLALQIIQAKPGISAKELIAKIEKSVSDDAVRYAILELAEEEQIEILSDRTLVPV